MIIELYFFLFFVSLILIFLGYYSETDTSKIIGYGFVFMLGVMLFAPSFFGSVEDCEYSVYEVTTLNETATYTNQYLCNTQESKQFGFYIALVGIFGFIAVFTDYKRAKKKAEGDE